MFTNPIPYTFAARSGSKLTDGVPRRCLSAVTWLAPGVSAASLADIFKRTRDRHHQLGVTGVMLFDGDRFAYLLCGAAAEVSEAFDAITADPRQTLPTKLADATDVPPWAERVWRTGWSEPDALAAVAAAAAPDEALTAWQAVIGASDLL